MHKEARSTEVLCSLQNGLQGAFPTALLPGTKESPHFAVQGAGWLRARPHRPSAAGNLRGGSPCLPLALHGGTRGQRGAGQGCARLQAAQGSAESRGRGKQQAGGEVTAKR